MAPKLSVLMVCTGNICRSPAADGMLKARLAEAGLGVRVHVDGCGTHGYHTGDPPDPRMIRAARRRGLDLSDLRARPLEASDFSDFDLLIAMDRGHLRILKGKAPRDAHGTVTLFSRYLPDAPEADVPDPYYDDDHAFETTLDMLEQGMDRLVTHIETLLRDPG